MNTMYFYITVVVVLTHSDDNYIETPSKPDCFSAKGVNFIHSVTL